MEKKMETLGPFKGIYRGSIGVIMEKKMETTGIIGYILGLYSPVWAMRSARPHAYDDGNHDHKTDTVRITC